MEFAWTPLRYMAQETWSISSPGPDIRTLVLPKSTQSSFPFKLDFQVISFVCSFSSNSVMVWGSSAYKISHWHPVRNPWMIATRTMINTINIRGLRQALINTHFQTENLTQVAINTHSASGIFIHGLHEPHQPLLNAKLAKSLPDDTSGYMMKCFFFQINKCHVQCFVDGMEYFL